MVELTYSQALLYNKAIMKAAESLSDEVALSVPLLFPRWETGVYYEPGFRVSEEIDGEATLYKLREGMAHTSQEDWPPHLTPAMWQRIDDPSEEWPEWVRPTGAHDAYAYGAKSAGMVNIGLINMKRIYMNPAYMDGRKYNNGYFASYIKWRISN